MLVKSCCKSLETACWGRLGKAKQATQLLEETLIL